MDRITTHGLNMPKLGLGTWPMKGADCVAGVQSALDLGYRHIDTAEIYGNEAAVGEGIAGSAVPRADIHVTSKVWHEHLGPDDMQAAMEKTLTALRTDYVDLYLIHWPSPAMDLPQAVESLVRLKEQGHARAIGVSNFPVALLRRAVEEIGAPIACNQVEYHVLLSQAPVLGYAGPHDVAVTAYSPLARNKVLEFEELTVIGRKHGATAAQVALKWLLDQHGVAAIPKASRPERQKANLDAMRITLDDTDRAAIAQLPKALRQINPGFAPAWDK